MLARGYQRLLVLVLSAAALLGTSASAQAVRFGPVNPAKIGIPSGARDVGTLPSATVVHAAVALAPRDSRALAAYATAVTTPGSALYHHYLSVAQFARRFGPSPAEIGKVRAALAAQGLMSGAVSANRLSLPVTSTAALASRAFSTSMDRYQLSRGRAGYTTTIPPSVPSSVSDRVQAVIGLTTVAPSASVIMHAGRHSTASASPVRAMSPRPRAASGGPAGPQSCPGAQSSGGYAANQIASAYGLGGYYASGDEGRGTTIALYELEPFSAPDIAAYQSCYGTNTSVRTIPVDGGAGAGSGSGEAAMDLEDLIGLAPQASIRVYEGPATGAGAYETYSRIISDDSAQVISTSWGLCEALEGSVSARAESTLFEEAAVQGQSLLASAGDQGSDDCGNHRQSVDDPASQPWVTAVGGTSLQASGDVVWNDAAGATGGGVSGFWGRPTYQDGVVPNQSGVSCGSSNHACREVPDISVDGDPSAGYAIYYLGAWRMVGGSSISTPTVAALTALTDASSACGGLSVGFLNPGLYRAADDYSANFHDVTSGSNSFDSVAGYSAGPGYDLASGLGSPAAALGPALCREAIRLSAPHAQRTVAGRFEKLHLSALTTPGQTIRYSVTGLPAGLTVDRESGAISGTPSHPGRWIVTATATNAAGGASSISFIWTVVASASASRSRISHAALALRLGRPVDRSSWVGAMVDFRSKGRDPRGQRLTYMATGLPRGLRISRRTGLISGKPRRAEIRIVRVRVTDGRGHAASIVFRWTIARRHAKA